MSKEKAVALVQPDMALQAKEYINWMKVQTKEAKQAVKDDPKKAVKIMVALETAALRASKFNMEEIQIQASRSQLEIQRTLGEVLIKEGRKPGQSPDDEGITLKEIGIDKSDSSRYKKLAAMPKFVYVRGIASAHIPSLNQMLREASRYKQLKAVIDQMEEPDKDALKRFVEEGYTSTQAEEELFSDDGGSGGMIDDDGDEDLVIESNFTVIMSEFSANAEAMQSILDEVVPALEGEDPIDAEELAVGLEALKKMVIAVKALKQAFKDAKDRANG